MAYDGRVPQRRVRSEREVLLDWLAEVPEVVWLAAEEPCAVCGWPTEQGEVIQGEMRPICARCHLLSPWLREIVCGRYGW